jgi:hypothetical protein
MCHNPDVPVGKVLRAWIDDATGVLMTEGELDLTLAGRPTQVLIADGFYREIGPSYAVILQELHHPTQVRVRDISLFCRSQWKNTLQLTPVPGSEVHFTISASAAHPPVSSPAHPQ